MYPQVAFEEILDVAPFVAERYDSDAQQSNTTSNGNLHEEESQGERRVESKSEEREPDDSKQRNQSYFYSLIAVIEHQG